MLTLNTEARLNNVNLRAEKAGDDAGEPAIDLAFTALMAANDAKPLLTKTDDPSRFERLMAGLWDDDGDLNILGIKKLAFDTEIPNVDCQIQPQHMAETTFIECKVKRVFVKPETNRTMQVSFLVQTHPREGDMDLISKLMLRDMAVRLEQKQTEMDV